MKRKTTAIGLLLAAVFWAGSVWVGPRAERSDAVEQELLYYPSGKFLKNAVVGYAQAAAAVAWLQTVQYYGKHKRGDRVFDMMYHLCDIVTDLDPKFTEPYTFGSFVLFTDAGKPEEGFRLLQKAREKNPDSWEAFFESGFAYYVFAQDYPRAAGYFRKAAELPGAPEYTARFAAYVAQRAGELETSLVLWQELARRTDNPAMRKWAEEKIEEIQAKMAASGHGSGS